MNRGRFSSQLLNIYFTLEIYLKINQVIKKQQISIHMSYSQSRILFNLQNKFYKSYFYRIRNKKMSYAYYHYLTRDLDYEAARSRFHLAQSLRRSRERLEADAITEEVLRRSRVEAEIAAQQALRRSRVQADLIAVSAAKEVALRRSRVQGQIAAQEVVREQALRRSRMDIELEMRRQTTDAILRRSRVEAASNFDKVTNTIAKSRLESQLQANRVASQNLLKDFARRERIKQDVDKILNRY